MSDMPETAARLVGDVLRAGGCPHDDAFDRFLPEQLSAVSSQYWTPLVVATRAAAWLDQLRIETVVDIGSGAGKFCVAAALASQCRFIGLEQSPSLVASAGMLATLFGVDDRVSFIEGAFGEVPTPVAECYYLFNPFGDYDFGPGGAVDANVACSAKQYAMDVVTAEDFLQEAPIGTCVLTYNGFGGEVPATYTAIRVDRHLSSVLKLWRKSPRSGLRASSRRDSDPATRAQTAAARRAAR